MEKSKPPDQNNGEPIVRRYGDVEVRLELAPAYEATDVVLSALRNQLAQKVIDMAEYALRRDAYLSRLLPPPPTDAA